ncbi:hypothetical protein [Saccharothrix sp. Mg75]|uniref:hypothetical protein n=1 Tax=Saccharothrix sp. Mg75 TaxID=3445357 RepID=UPI003EE98272
MSTSHTPADRNPVADAPSRSLRPFEHGDTGEVDPGQGDRCEAGDVTADAVGFDPDTVEGAAVMRLLRRYKDLEHDDPERSVSGGDAVELLDEWFHSLGVDLDNDPLTTAQKLRLAVRRRPGGSLTARGAYSVRIGTEHPEPDHLVHAALHALAERLGPDTGIDLSNCDGGLLARYEHAAAPQAPATPGPDLLEILQTLVATTHGYDADRVRLDPDDFEWAELNGYPLIIIRRADGGVILTKFHTPQCAFVTSAGVAECDCD